MKRRLERAWLGVLASASLLGFSSCSKQGPPTTVVLVTLDTTRADRLSTYGHWRKTDPFLKEFAEKSRVFEVGVPPATWTLPSHVSMFSGLDPAEHGCWLHLEDAGESANMPAVSDSTMLVTERLTDFHRIAAVGGPFASSRYGLLRGFDTYKDPGDAWELSAAEINEFVFDALDKRPKDKGLFLFVNYFDAHAPYDAPPDREYPFPEEPRELPAVPPLDHWDVEKQGPIPDDVLQDAVDQYDRELLVVDTALKELFDRLEADDLLDNALVIITSDHGEMFGESGETYGHGCLPYEGVARVPLIVHRSGGPKDRILTPVSNANVAATILHELELPLLPPGGGAPRFNLLDLPEELPLPYVEHRGGGSWICALRGERFKFGSAVNSETLALVPNAYLLFDLDENSTETAELASGPEADKAEKAMRSTLTGLIQGWDDPPSDLNQATLSQDEMDALKGIGY